MMKVQWQKIKSAIGKFFSTLWRAALHPSATVCILLGLCIIIISVFGETSAPAAANRKLPIYSVERDDKCISLTIDAAWGNEYTSKIIEILDRYDIKITFFTVDFWAQTYPDDIKALKMAGHEIGNHSATHPDMAKLSKEEICNEITTTWQTQQALAGSSAVRLFRAPYGSYNNTLIEACEELGFYCIQWDVDSIDWKTNATADDVVNRVLSKVQSGSIILMHNNSQVIIDVLPRVIEALLEQGYTFVPVSQLIHLDNYTIDANGRQHASS